MAAFTRLVRSSEHTGDLLKAITENVRVLHCETTITPSTPEGKLVFQTLAMIAAIERDYIVRRHTAGRVAQWRRGEWIPNAYPPGCLKIDKQLQLDAPMVDPVRQMLTALGDPNNNSASLVEEFGALGVTTPKLQEIYGPGATIADARNPTEVITTLLGWREAYRTGRYELLWTNPFPGIESIAGVPVEASGDPERPNGVLKMVYDIPVPDGGWADEETFDRIEQRLRRRIDGVFDTGGTTHSRTAPLAGFFRTVDSEGRESKLFAGESGTTYRLLRRPLDESRRHTGWTSAKSDAAVVAVIERRDLHRSIVETAAAAFEAGLPADLDITRFVQQGTLPRFDPAGIRRRTLDRDLTDVRGRLRIAKRNAELAGDDEDAKIFVDEVLALTKAERQLIRRLELLRTKRRDAILTPTFESDAAQLVYALSTLAQLVGSGPAQLRSALRIVISNETMTLGEDCVHWSLTLELPHGDGTVILGPIIGSVPCRRPRGALLSGLVPTLPKRTRRAMVNTLIGLGYPDRAARAAAACPHPELVAALTAAARHEPVPPGLDPSWARWVADEYRRPDFAWERNKWRLTYPTRQAVLDAIHARDGAASRSDLEGDGFVEVQLRYLARDLPGPTGWPILAVEGRGASKRYSLLACPHCGRWASESSVTPETKPGILCPDCLRLPIASSPVFPSWYVPIRSGKAGG